MGGLVIEAVAVLNEDNPEFFNELMKKGVDAVEPEMIRQQRKRMKRQVELGFEHSSISNKFIVSISNNGSQWTGALVDNYENCKKILDTFIEIDFEDVTDYAKLNEFQKLREKRDALEKEKENE